MSISAVFCLVEWAYWFWWLRKVNEEQHVVWLFNGTSTQKGQFVPTAGKGNRLSRLKMANEIQCILPYVTR